MSSTNAAIATAAPNTASMVVVHVPNVQNPLVTEESLSQKLSWHPEVNGPITIGLLQLKKDITDTIKDVFLSNLALEDILRFFILHYNEAV
ncbi:hypothetical protein V5O48_002108, partial [Marasmius crinis-equi]